MNSEDIDPDLRRLIDAHPMLFRGEAPACSSYVCAGWYDLLDKLCTDIEVLLGPSGCTAFEVSQIKEKFGTLRFYYRFGDSEDFHIDLMGPGGPQHLVSQTSSSSDDANLVARLRDLVNGACTASESMCDRCGAPAQFRDIRHYYSTLCEQHYLEISAEREALRARP